MIAKALRLMALPLSSLIGHSSLVLELAKRDVQGRYRGASFGLLWSLISPFLMLMIYAFAFGSVMKGRWPQIEAGHTSFSIILFAGLIVHGFFAECFNKSVSLITSNPNFVKRVIFPLEILPWPMVLSALFHVAMNLAVFIVLRFFMDGTVTWTTIFFPLVLLPLAVLVVGISWFMAAAGVYFRDLSQITGPVSMAMLFLSSAMMPIESVPESYRWVFQWNPLSFVIDQARDVLLWGRLPDWAGLGAYLLASSVVFYLGYLWFKVTRRGFADVI